MNSWGNRGALQPGERVYALLEWSFTVGGDKKYSFILVGGSYVRSNGTQRGRVTFLQPINKSWEIADAKEGRHSAFEAPVYSLALYDEMTYIACFGQYISLQRFSVDEKKWSWLRNEKSIVLGSPRGPRASDGGKT